MRLDADGRRRYHYRGLNGIAGGTCDSWAEAYQARQEVKRKAAETIEATKLLVGLSLPGDNEKLEEIVARMNRAELRKLPLVYYAIGAYWRDMRKKLDLTTRLDYQADLAVFVGLAGHLTLAELEEQPLRVSELKDKIEKEKTFPAGHRRAGEVATAAADDVLTVGSAICRHALERRIIFFNPFVALPRFHRQRSRGNNDGGSYRRIDASEVKSPATIVEVGIGMRGFGATLWERRLVPLLIAIGMRPEDICAMRNRWWRGAGGPLKKITAPEATKDIEGHLFLGQPKTGARKLELFEFIGQLLERLYQAQGAPGLDALTFPNAVGTMLDWGNWRRDVWYPALYRSGLVDTPAGDDRPSPTDGPGDADVPAGQLELAEDEAVAFHPYVVRHTGVKTMQHALVPLENGKITVYSQEQVARQFGNTHSTIDRVYGGIPEDLLQVSGMTMTEIYEKAWHGVWGPMPGEDGYEDVLYSTKEASALIGHWAERDQRYQPVSSNALGGRIARGTLPATRRGARYYVSEWDLAWHCLIPPAGQRG
jgi:hypothetical protein